jgi:hypothetical protein
VIADLVDGTSITARISAVDGGVVVLQPDKGDPLSVPLAELIRGTVQVEFNRSEKE